MASGQLGGHGGKKLKSIATTPEGRRVIGESASRRASDVDAEAKGYKCTGMAHAHQETAPA